MTSFIATITYTGLDMGSDFNKARFLTWCKEHAGKTVRIELPKTQRSGQQNRYYWLYLGLISREYGNDVDDLHEYFRKRFLPRETFTIKGPKGNLKVERIKSTTKLSKVEFGEYLDRIAAETEIPLPDRTLAGYYLN